MNNNPYTSKYFTTNEMEVIEFNRFRIKECFSLFPFCFKHFVWTGKWFSKIKVKEQALKYRVQMFDDGWTYSFYWGGWNLVWEFVEIIEDDK